MSANVAPELVGTWRLIEFWDRDSAAAPKSYTYGEQPTGYFIYDPSGHVSIQIQQGPRPPVIRPQRGEDWFRKASLEELRATVEAFRAYFGTYSVDRQRGIVIHQVEGDSRALYTGTLQRRRFRLVGDSLIIGNDTTARRVLLRVRAQDSVVTSRASSNVEDVYVAHAVRQSRTRPTSFCDENRIGFGRALFEDRFVLRSVETRPSDGRIMRTDVQPIGSMHVCFGLTADSATLNFRAEGTLAEVRFIGNGQCLSVRGDFPEKGITVMRCFLDFGGLPAGYIGGHLTSNTVLSRVAVGEASDPPGYIQPSIVTIRLWRRR